MADSKFVYINPWFLKLLVWLGIIEKPDTNTDTKN